MSRICLVSVWKEWVRVLCLEEGRVEEGVAEGEGSDEEAEEEEEEEEEEEAGSVEELEVVVDKARTWEAMDEEDKEVRDLVSERSEAPRMEDAAARRNALTETRPTARAGTDMADAVMGEMSTMLASEADG